MPSFITYMGGKHSISKRIIPYFPEHRRYVEVFMGSAAVFFAKPKVQINILNDKNSNLVNLFNTLKDYYPALLRWVKTTPISRELYDQYNEICKRNTVSDMITHAGMYLYLIRLSYNCEVGQGFVMTGFSRYNSWSNKWKETLQWFSNMLDNVIIENLDFAELIDKYDGNNTFMYLDPPYYVANDTNYYEIVFTQSDHLRLYNALKNTKCKWLMSYDDNPYIKSLYKDFDIEIIKDNPLPSGSKSDIPRFKDEIIISNYKLPKQQYKLF